MGKKKRSPNVEPRRSGREQKYTEKGQEFSLTLVVQAIKMCLRRIDKKTLEVESLVFTIKEPGVSSILSATLSELTRLKEELKEHVDKLPTLMDPEAPYLKKVNKDLENLQLFIDSQNELLCDDVPSDRRPHSTAPSCKSMNTATSCGSEASVRLKARLALALQQNQIKTEEILINNRLLELERELATEKQKKLNLTEKTICSDILIKSLEEAKEIDEVEAVLEVIGPVADSVKLSSLMLPTANHKLAINEKIERTDDKKANIPPSVNTLPHYQENYLPQTDNKERINTKEILATTSQRTDPLMLMTKIQVLNSLVPFLYGGDSLNFPLFRETVRTHLEDGVLPDNEKKIFLNKFLKGEALELILGNVGLSYDDSIFLLERRFGNPVRITEAWVKRLVEGPNLKVSDPKGMLKFSENLLTACRVLSEGALREVSTKICMKKIVSRLPQQYISKWVASIESLDGLETIHDLASFVEKTTRTLSHPIYSPNVDDIFPESSIIKKVNTAKGLRNVTSPDKKNKERRVVGQVVHSGPINKEGLPVQTLKKNLGHGSSCDICGFCSKKHLLEFCDELPLTSDEKRKDFIKKNGLCWSCLGHGHITKFCKQRLKCQVLGCEKLHPTSLHVPNDNHKSTATTRSSTTEKYSGVTSFIIPVHVYHKNHPEHKVMVYALLDDGSDSCFISDHLRGELNIKGIPTKLELSTMLKKTTVPSLRISDLTVTSFDGKKEIHLPANTYTRQYIPASTDEIPTPDLAKQFPHLKGIANHLQPLQDTEIDILNGSNCPKALCPLESIRGEDEEPYGLRTELGWGIIGPRHSQERYEQRSRRVSMKELINMFNIDVSSEEKNFGLGQSVNDKCFIEKITRGLVLRTDKHYEIPLPLKNENILMPSNKVLAIRRLNSLKKKFQSEKYKDDYVKFMDEQLQNGYAELADNIPVESGRLWYLPHHGVYHPRKPEKIRVVFDCSALYKGVSLNSMLLSSPDLTNSVIGILVRFRQEKIAFVGDLEGMFLQVVVPEKYRNLLRFLWWEDGDTLQKPKEYRMTVHLFGASSSPGCANFALRKTAEDHGEQVSERASKFVFRNFYMDDGCGSVESVQEAVEIIKELQDLCSRGGFRFHKLLSSSPEVIKTIQNEDRASGLKEFDTKGILPLERALGVAWSVEFDSFQFRVRVEVKPFTRRGILSTICSAYDPLGFLAPFIIKGKIILQDLCREHLGTNDRWDEEVSEEMRSRWERWLHDLEVLSTGIISVPRCYKPLDANHIESIELHHFCDASTAAYGHVSYLRFIYDGGKIHCSFIFGKSRVRPLKELTVPRLELTAAVSVAKTSEMLQRELDYKVVSYFWTDSKVVLGYITNVSKRFHVFVANRIQTIRDCSDPKSWTYVPSKKNPADFASRGMTAVALKDSSWLKGPDFLWKPELQPLENRETVDVLDSDPEVKKVVAREVRIKTQNFTERFLYWSSWHRLVKSVALARRYLKRLKNHTFITNIKNNPLTPKELKEAEACILFQVQQEKIGQSYKKDLMSLHPFEDDQALIRVGGRIKHSLLPSEEKHPIIVPSGCHVSTLLIRDSHEKVCHQGRGLTMNRLRAQGYWIIKATAEVSRYLNSCVECRRLRGSFERPRMADVPSERLKPAPPFTYTAADVFGPFYVKQRRSQVKRWGIIFTCMACRAVDIDILDSMVTDSFINALRRFLCSRGPIKSLRTDLGTNFVGAKEELRRALDEIKEDVVRSTLCKRYTSVDFQFSPADASHTNGVVERQIGTVRRILDFQLRHHPGLLNEDCLRTLLKECEAIINGRPLGVEALTDPSVSPLTPSHLLTLKSPVLSPPGKFENDVGYTRRRSRQVQYLAEEFWTRWSKEYLQSLHYRTKWNKVKRNLSIGDIVMVKDSTTPRNTWPLARIVGVEIKEDGIVRTVTIKRKDSLLKRAAQSVVLLLEADE